MRFLVKVNIPVEAGNAAAKAGKLGTTIQSILADLKPEAVYFTADNGQRTALLFLEMQDASQIPAIAEPWFLAFNASIEIHPVMTPDDLARAGNAIEAAVNKYCEDASSEPPIPEEEFEEFTATDCSPPRPPRQLWDEEGFLRELSEKTSADAAAKAEKIIRWAERIGITLDRGTAIQHPMVGFKHPRRLARRAGRFHHSTKHRGVRRKGGSSHQTAKK